MRIATAIAVGLQSLPVVYATPVPPQPDNELGASAVRPFQDGSVKGFVDSHGNSVFLGVPYADTTGGKNRYVSRDWSYDSLACAHN
jgi:hypothetical protein